MKSISRALMKYFLIAGEASGDLHASELIKQLSAADKSAQFAFLGGDLMMQAAGVEPVIHYRDMAYMGFVEVAKHLVTILRNYKTAKKAIDRFQPDWLILIDYPSFNLKMAKYAHKTGIKVAYYISPKVWAWKSWRVKDIKKYVDKMLCIFPFEVDFYAKKGYAVEYIGNPSVEEIDQRKSAVPSRFDFTSKNNLQDKQIIALLPGSRMAELRSNLPLMERAIKRFPQYRGVVAGAPGISPDAYASITSLPVVYGQTYDLLGVSRAAVVTSGTATLETALMGIPQVAVYRNNGSRLAYEVMKRVLKVKYVTLPNLIADESVVPELLLHLCTEEAIFDELSKILPDRDHRRKQLEGYQRVRSLLGNKCAARNAAYSIMGATQA